MVSVAAVPSVPRESEVIGKRQDLAVSAARHALGAQVTTAGLVTTVGGVVGIRRGNGDPWLGFVGSDPAGDWRLAPEDSPPSGRCSPPG